MTDRAPLSPRGGADVVELGPRDRHLRLRDPKQWERMTGGERASYELGWLDCALLTNDVVREQRETAHG